MKYMGSKRWMLQNGLADLIARELKTSLRFVDLFSGSSAVSAHVATKYELSVSAYDLQEFSTVLARAVLSRESPVDAEQIWKSWFARAREIRQCAHPPGCLSVTRESVDDQRRWCAEQPWPITRAYGGYYFSAIQAVWLDALRETVPRREPGKSVAIAALLRAASQCCAAPGHTAQPFQPTRTAKPFLIDAWRKKVLSYSREALSTISKQCAKVRGHAETADANNAAKSIREGDLAFIDPPYSGVHYSRFYHVLETIARGGHTAVSGRGRYPAKDERPWSKYSVRSGSSDALDDLLETVSSKGANAILTFPQRMCSNGLSGRAVVELASKYFEVESHWVASKFSTLGGNNDHRDARRMTRELILVLKVSSG